MESFLGSVWFGLFMGVLGYVAGHIVSVDKIKGWIRG
jgi:hypothetical protein